MIHEKWFISDTHFGHSNMLKFKRDDGTPVRDFKDTFEMDETMVQNWNSVVKDNDYVYHLGDVTFRYDGYFNNIMSRLKGKKRMLVGNHDKLQNPNLFRWFEKVEYWKGFPKENFTITHVPHIIDKIRDGEFNVHGHTHQTNEPDPRHINVCVEVRDYTPVHMDTILEEIKQRS